MAAHLADVTDRRGGIEGSSTHRGGQTAADRALAELDVAGYSQRHRLAYPQPKRVTTGLSPWIRHGLLPLDRVWAAVEGAAPDDAAAFRRHLLSTEYARHVYARERSAPPRTASADRPASAPARGRDGGGSPSWDRTMGCVDIALDELEEDGFVPPEARRWLAVHWVRHHGHRWDLGDDHLHRHLLDGSRATGRLGWQSVTGLDRPRFSRWEVEAWAPGLCASCEVVATCPIERSEPVPEPTDPGRPWADAGLAADPDPDRTAGPDRAIVTGEPEAVWITAESMGDADPALVAHPDLPAVFVFDRPLLGRLRLSAKRLVFLVETLADLAARRPVEIWVGDPGQILPGRPLAATFTPVPGWRRWSAELAPVAVHPWPWLVRPQGGDIRTFDVWRTGARTGSSGYLMV